MNSAVECNNIGVTLLQLKRPKEALDAFQWAAQLLYPVSQSFQVAEEEYQSQNPHRMGVDCHPQTVFACCHPLPANWPAVGQATLQSARSMLATAAQPQQQWHNNRKTDDDEICSDFLSSKPILLKTLCEQQNPRSCTFEASVVLFNMALAYVNSLPYCGGNEPLTKALCLFEMSFSLSHLLMEHHSSSAAIALASLNNTGCVHHRLGEYELARHCWEVLAAYLDATSSVKVVSPNERHTFLLNAALLREPQMAGAA